MGAPNLTLAVEPSEAGSIVYLPLAAKTASDKPAALLALQLMITNKGNTALHVNNVTLSFTSPPM